MAFVGPASSPSAVRAVPSLSSRQLLASPRSHRRARVSRQPRCRATPPPSPDDANDVADSAPVPSPQDALLRDAQRLRARQESPSPSSLPLSLRSIVDTLLLWDVFLVAALLLWLLVALVPHFVAGNDTLLDPWLALWQPFIQPVLGVLMLGTIAQGAAAFFAPPRE